jgi:hypothetical protein
LGDRPHRENCHVFYIGVFYTFRVSVVDFVSCGLLCSASLLRELDPGDI